MNDNVAPVPGIYSPSQLDGFEERYEERLEYEARSVTRDLVRRYGFEAARDMLASILHDEADRRH